MKKFLLFLTLFLIAVAVFKVLNFDVPVKNIQTMTVEGTIGSATLTLEVVNTPSTRAQGLSGRQSMPAGTGMLFVFPNPGTHGFWMKDMNFPIDIIWLDDELRIIGVEKNASPQSFPTTFYPPSEVSFVLEVPSGFYEGQSLNLGEGLFLRSQNSVLEGTF